MSDDITFHMNKVEFGWDSLDEAFPYIEQNHDPMGSYVLVELRVARSKTKGGIILASSDRDTEQWNTQVAKVIAVGPLAFKNRNTGELWPEGAWAVPGDFVRIPKDGGDSWSVLHEGDEVVFKQFKDLDLLGKVRDPLKMKAFL